MRTRWLSGAVIALALLLCLSMAACQPITAPAAQAAAPAAASSTQETNTVEINKAAVRGWFEAFNSHDLDKIDAAIDKYYAPNYVLHDPTVPNFSGGAQTLKPLVRESIQTLPDLHLTVEDIIAEGDSVAIRVRVQGTEPSGNPLDFWTMSMVRFENGQWADEWELAEATGEEVVGSDIGGSDTGGN